MSQSDDVLVPPSTPRPAKSGLGCLATIVLFVVIVVVGLLIGRLLGDDTDDTDRSELVADGIAQVDGKDVAWRVDAVEDEAGDTCVFLYEDGEQLTGACDPTPQDATLGTVTVVFGQVPADADDVTVELDDGTQQAVETFERDGFSERFYAVVVDRDVDAVRLVP